MKVATTKTLARELNKRSPYNIDLVEVDFNFYYANMNVYFLNKDYLDYNYKSGKYNLIRVSYPDNLYCYPAYIGTHELRNILSDSGSKTIEDFSTAFNEIYEI